MKKLEGIIIPCVTPFDESGALRLDWMRENYKKWNASHISGCMALGTNGEFRALSDEEAFEVIRTAAEIMEPEKIFIAGIGRESLHHTIEFLKRLEAAQIRIDYVSVLTPCYFRKLMTDAALIDYYTEIADVSAYPVLLYCAPSYANEVRISAEAIKVLADHPNIAGVKDTSPDMMNAYMDAVGERDDFEVFAGALSNIKTCIERGGKGGILSSANYIPDTCAKFYQIVQNDGLEHGLNYLDMLKTFAKETGGLGGVAGVKAAMNLMGYSGGVPRKPVLPCKPDVIDQMRAFIQNNRGMVTDKI